MVARGNSVGNNMHLRHSSKHGEIMKLACTHWGVRECDLRFHTRDIARYGCVYNELSS